MFMSSTDWVLLVLACTPVVSPKHRGAFGRSECRQFSDPGKPGKGWGTTEDPHPLLSNHSSQASLARTYLFLRWWRRENIADPCCRGPAVLTEAF